MNEKNPTLTDVLTPEKITNMPANLRVLAEARKTAITPEPPKQWDILDLLIKGGLMIAGIVLAIAVMCGGIHR